MKWGVERPMPWAWGRGWVGAGLHTHGAGRMACWLAPWCHALAPRVANRVIV